MGITLCVICCFSLAAFYIGSLCLIFIPFINMHLGVFALGLSCLELSGFLGHGKLYPSPFEGSFDYYLLENFLMRFLFYYSSETPMSLMLGHLTLSQRSLRLSSFLLILFFFFSFFSLCFIYIFHSIFHLTYPLFCLLFYFCVPLSSIQFSSVALHVQLFETLSDQISRSVVSDSLRPHELQHARPPCPSPTPGLHSDSRPLNQ